MEPATVVAIVGVISTILLSIIGFLWRRYQSMKEEIESLEQDVDDAQDKTEKIMSIMFGREIDPSDDGLAEEVQLGFSEIADEVEELNKDIDELDGAMRVVIIRLDEHDDIDFDKENLSFDAELRSLE